MQKIVLAAAFIGLLVMPALAQNPPQGTRAVVRCTIEKLDGRSLVVKTGDGQTETVTLDENFTVSSVAKRTLADLKPGDMVATNSVKGTDGRLHAKEMHIFPEAMRATFRDVQAPSSLVPGGLMTNARVVEITSTPTGQLLKGKYKDGELEVVVEPDAPIVTYAPGEPRLLKPGATAVIFATKHPDGSLTAPRVVAEKDGVKPPM
jgi:hypothetical protein